MERADILTRLRGDHLGSVRGGPSRTGDTDRFRTIFGDSSPENARRIIMWCLERDPMHRPTAEELLMVCRRCNCYVGAVVILTRVCIVEERSSSTED